MFWRNWLWPEVDEKETVLGALRRRMRAARVGILLVYSQDEHGSEYVADRDKRVQFVSGFTGSTAVAIIGTDFAELAVDSRYYLIARNQISAEWRVRELGRPGVLGVRDAVVELAAKRNTNVAVDPALVLNSQAIELQSALRAQGLQLKPVPGIVDAVWAAEQPPLPDVPVVVHPLKYSGETAASKVAFLRAEMAKQGAKTFVMYDLTEIAYTLNLRGGDIPYTPVFKAFLVVSAASVVLYTDSALAVGARHEGLRVLVHGYARFFRDLARVAKPAWVPSGASWAIVDGLRDSGAVTAVSPINSKRAIKNAVEIAGLREAQIRCSLSVVKYLAWLEHQVGDWGYTISEWDGALKLLAIREALPDFRGLSYEVISAVGPHSSMPHYAPTSESHTLVTTDDIYLLDSGSQFLQGTTDITRTVHLGTPRADHIRAYTLVLKGQLAASHAVFPQGRNASGLDFLARQFLWAEGLDYGHGTGHGVGSYLCVHEMPLGIYPTSNWQSDLQPGHFLTIEPGYYKDDDFGIRIENDVLVVPNGESGGKQFLKFETLTKVPYYRKLIDETLLGEHERRQINEYHESCLSTLLHLLAADYERDWLLRNCAKI